MSFLSELAARRRFGVKPGLQTIAALCAKLGDPQKKFPAIHVAGTNGKGAVSTILASVLRARHTGLIGCYTSPHLVRLNERFSLDGEPVDDATLERLAQVVEAEVSEIGSHDACALTFFEALTAVAFRLFAERRVAHAVLECGLGGRLDATNVCQPELCVITKIGLDHCDWLGETVEKIAVEKAGIIKPDVPVVLARNPPVVCAVVRQRALEVGAPFHYAPDLADESEIPADFPLPGVFNRENAVTALAALRVLLKEPTFAFPPEALATLVWPGRFHRVGSYLIDGAHNPPAAESLVAALAQTEPWATKRPLNLIFAACGDKDVDAVLAILKPWVARGFAVRTKNPRAVPVEVLAAKMGALGIDATPCAALEDALAQTSSTATLVCGSLFLAGEALVALGAFPWPAGRFDVSEIFKSQTVFEAEKGTNE